MSKYDSNRSRVRRFYDSAARIRENNSISNRRTTRIFHLRNFNNWTKSVFINEYIQKIRTKQSSIYVLDLCCGKGGDQLKWSQSRVRHVTFVDISRDSVDICQQRYKQLLSKKYGVFSADFHVLDCTDPSFRTIISPNHEYDLVSCQFALHYAFESFDQACTLLRNVSEALIDGGYFIASIPNAYEIVRRAQASFAKQIVKTKELSNSTNSGDTTVQEISFGNSVYSVRFPSSSFCSNTSDKQLLKFRLFGAKYDFRLDGVVDCPEFLVYPPLLNELAERYHLYPVKKPLSFGDNFYEALSTTSAGFDPKELLMRMEALEHWEDSDHASSSDPDSSEYAHVIERLSEDIKHSQPVGTLTKSEWEVATMYSLVAFQKSTKCR